MRSGETQIQVQFTMPYSGSLRFDPKPLYPAELLVIVIPKTMQFGAANASQLQAMNDPSKENTTVENMGRLCGTDVPPKWSGSSKPDWSAPLTGCAEDFLKFLDPVRSPVHPVRTALSQNCPKHSAGGPYKRRCCVAAVH